MTGTNQGTTNQVFLMSASGPSLKAPTVGQTQVVIVGATGMVGGYALRYALNHPAVGTVTAIGRKKVGISHPKVKEVLHQDFADCSALSEALSRQDAAVYCLGTYTGAVTDAELRETTVDYTVEFARVFRINSPGAAFSFLSGNGADPTGRSRIAFARYKGQAETALLRPGSPAFISSDRRTSILWSRGRNRISATALCARCTPRFGCCSPTR